MPMHAHFVESRTQSVDTEDSDPHIEAKTYHVCCLFHGMNGDPEVDWETWVDVLTKRYPSWHIHTMKCYKGQTGLCGEGLDWLAVMAAEEVKAVLEEVRDADHTGADPNIVLHCIGHSMGGVIIRGLLPELEEIMGQDMPELGHYLSLSSPHLGVQAPWCSPMHSYRNLLGLLLSCSLLPAQLAIQDKRIPYLVQISANRYLQILSRFRTRTCVGLTVGDPLISLPSATIDHENTQTKQRFCEPTFWCFDKMDIESGTPFEELTEKEDSKKYFEKCPADTPRAGGSFGCGDLCAYVWQGFWLWFGSIFLWLFCVPCVCFRVAVNRQKAPQGNVFKELQEAPPPRRFSVSAYGKTKTLTSLDSHEVAMSQMQSMPLSGSMDSFNVDNGADKKATKKGKVNTKLEWVTSQDGTNVCPKIMLEALRAMDWQRITVNFHRTFRGAKNKHVFLIGKQPEQHADEHTLSRECITCLAEIFADIEREEEAEREINEVNNDHEVIETVKQ